MIESVVRGTVAFVAVAVALVGAVAVVVILSEPMRQAQQRKRAECEAVPGRVYVGTRDGSWCVEGERK